MFDSRVLILDGAMGTMIQRHYLTENDFRGQRFASWNVDLLGNNDLLCLTCPGVIEEISTQYVKAGADIISTNTFNANAISQADYDMEHLVREMNVAGARIARRVADAAPRRVLVAGSMGPTNKTASMSPDIADPGYRAVSYDELYDAYAEQIEGLIEGGVDLLLFETIFDTLNVKAGLDAAVDVMARLGRELPVMLSVTIAGRDGRTFSGQTLEAFIASVSHAPIASLGLNCSFGAREIMPWVEHLARISPWPVTCHPNAGLPDENGDYNDSPASMAAVMAEMVKRGLVNVIGGCCGTTPEHIAAYADIVRGAVPHVPTRLPEAMRLSGLEMVEVSPANNFTNIGERCNVAGSRKFLRLIKEGALGEALDIARRQVADGARIIDINMDDGLLDARVEMCRFLNLLAAEPDIARVPVMIDSSDWNVIEAALKCVQGKSIVNSISLKEGENVFLQRASRIRRLGAAVVVMAFDETGQADSYERKIEVCARAYDLLVNKAAFDPQDIIFDPNILSIATGIPEHDGYGLDFIRAVGWIKRNLPGAKVSGGVSNLSFAFRGNTPLREAMHAVFLYHAIREGMDMAILNPATAVTYDSIDPSLRSLLEDVILNRRPGASDELAAYAAEQARVMAEAKSSGKPVQSAEKSEWRTLPVGERLGYALQHGIDSYLSEDLAEAMNSGMTPVGIIDGPLMQGMNHVGTLFGEGRMFLPQVVRTARTMKAAVAILQPEIDRHNSSSSPAGAGTVLFATVKGDVHDIGKNIVSIVMGCNGYKVIDLGVMVPADTIVQRALDERPDIICLSGLITPSLEEMAHVAERLDAAGLDIPLMVGGATTSALHTALKIAPRYRGVVIHVRDASQNPLLAARLLNPETREAFIDEVRREQQRLRDSHAASTVKLTPIAEARARSARRECNPEDVPSAEPLQTGRLLLALPVKSVEKYINFSMFLKAWGLPATLADAWNKQDCPACEREFLAAHADEARAHEALTLARDARAMLDRWIRQENVVMAAVAIEPAHAEGDDIIIEPTDGDRLTIPCLRRQTPDTHGLFPSLCDGLSTRSDYVGAFVVTFSTPADSARDDYEQLIADTLSHRVAEAASEVLHGVTAVNFWGYAEPGGAPESLGIRPAVGYPSMPDQTLTHELNKLLKMDEIGVTITENGAMHPTSTVCGLYFAPPCTGYFNLGPIGDDQLADYARRRGLTPAALRSLLNR